MAATRTLTYWCANFDFEEVLDHGLKLDAWMTQYQYEHGGFEYEGNTRQKGSTTKIWQTFLDVNVGDLLIAYLSGPPRVFAVGQVVKPKRRKSHSSGAKHFDFVDRTVREKCNLHFDGTVLYRDAPAFYEDFTDPWTFPVKGANTTALSLVLDGPGILVKMVLLNAL